MAPGIKTPSRSQAMSGGGLPSVTQDSSTLPCKGTTKDSVSSRISGSSAERKDQQDNSIVTIVTKSCAQTNTSKAL